MTTVNKQEYLKRYLSKDKDKKKKKKKVPKGIQDRVKIIDDNIDVHEQVQTIQDIENDNEDAPQVVAVIDDRPVELITGFKESNNWTAIDIKPNIKEEPRSPDRNSDHSPPRRRRRSSDESPPRKTNRRGNSDDESPPRRGRNKDESPPRRIKSEVADKSPPRRSRKYDSDESPPRKSKNNEKNRDYSPQDSSPVRIKRQDQNSSRKRNYDENADYSPPRRSKHDNSPPRRRNDGESSHRKKSDRSPTRRRRSNERSPSKSKKRDDSSRSSKKKSRWASKSPSPEPSTSKSTSKATKTLDGKTAGLQNAKDLVKETENFKRREAKLFQEMPTDISGVNASTVMRDRKTGKVRDLEAEAEIKSAQKEKTNELQKKYDQWGKGLKQTTDYNQKLEEAAYEMSKPLARYADDADLERHLKEQERAGDPMLDYIRKKKVDKAIKAGVKLKPEYMGEFMPNRYGIKPGHRWDGVDRSNGYEKKWFDAINKRNADKEEAYKWNSEDM
ncbi:BUD13 homolog [Atheta coriaria]|uniref:BUD13 homolog n=1 Tax=Dalotia coriaria TaxID=877792 RepID=UPI0031F3BAEB